MKTIIGVCMVIVGVSIPIIFLAIMVIDLIKIIGFWKTFTPFMVVVLIVGLIIGGLHLVEWGEEEHEKNS